jgi:lipopolysaccharide/colanic/teichoic acid biosynthesis glycosyltransferase
MTIAEMTESHYLTRHGSSDLAEEGASNSALNEASFFLAKRWLDRGLGLLLLIPALPLVALLVAAIRATSRGPGIFSQVRVGKSGKIFTMYKLRSMRLDAEAGTGPAWSVTGADPRVTRLGYWLRRLHLDELPQLFNVVRGEMSLIGPRPERPEFVKLLADEIPGYLNRLMVAPGITGLAQINLPPDSDVDSVRRKLVLDCEYIRTANLWLDVRITFCTLLRMAWIKGPQVTRLLGLERVVQLPSSPTSEWPSEGARGEPVSLAELAHQHRQGVHRLDAAPPASEAAAFAAAGRLPRSAAHERSE